VERFADGPVASAIDHPADTKSARLSDESKGQPSPGPFGVDRPVSPAPDYGGPGRRINCARLFLMGKTKMTAKDTRIPAWRQRAACRGVDPDIFYPVTDEEADDAKAICALCPVEQACLEWALSNRESDGVWGGATERERRRIIRRRRRSA
jgi:WhiB family transcriptional regulator, redox-sensing transcriptional regulator